MKNIILTLLAITFVSIIYAQTSHYVSTVGNDDGEGSLNDPWETIQYAMDNASPGSTVYILAGTYHEKVYLNVSGENGNWITFRNYNNDEVIIDGSGWTDPAILEIYDQSYVRIEGLFFINNIQLDAMGVFIEGLCHHIEILNCKISNIHFSNDPGAPVNENTNAQPLIVYGVEETPITDLLISGCEVFDSRTGYSEALAINGNVDGFEVSNNVVHDISNIGIDIIGHEGTCPDPALDQARNGVIKWNVVYNCQSPYASSAGIYVDGGKDLVIENNIVYNNQWGIEIGCENTGKTTSDVIVRNNFIYGNSSAGIQMGGYDYPNGSGKVTNSLILNNTCFNNATINNYDGELTLTYSEYCSVVNNIFYANNPEAQLISLEEVVSTPPGLTMNNNLWFHPDGAANIYIYWNGIDFESFEDFVNSTGQEQNSMFMDPLLVSDNPSDPDLHIKSDSPAIGMADPSYLNVAGDQDIDNEDRLNESLDLGADEYHASSGYVLNSEPGIIIYPNPAKDKINVISRDQDINFIEILDLNGKVIKRVEKMVNNSIAVDEIPSGLYLLRVSLPGGIGNGKLVVE